MNWKTFPKEKPNHGDIVAIRTAPEQGEKYSIAYYNEGTTWIDGDQWVKLNGEKRKPLSDGTLPMTESELIEFKVLFDWQGITKLKFDGIFLHAEMETRYVHSVKNVKAILWLADRFDLTSNN